MLLYITYCSWDAMLKFRHHVRLDFVDEGVYEMV